MIARLPSILLLGLLAAGDGPPARAPRTPTPRPAAARKDSGRWAARSARSSRWTGDVISLDVKDADLRDVLHTFSELTGLNLAVDPEVKGSVTVRLQDVPWDQALDVIVRTNGFGYVLEGTVLRVGLPSKL